MTVTATNRIVYREIERALARARDEKTFRDETRIDRDLAIQAHEVLYQANRLKNGFDTLWTTACRHYDMVRAMMLVSMHPEIKLTPSNDVVRLLALQQSRPPEDVAKLMHLGSKGMFFNRSCNLFAEAVTQVCGTGWAVDSGARVYRSNFSLFLGKKVREQREVPFELKLELLQDPKVQAISSADITLTPGAYLEWHWYQQLHSLVRVRHDGHVVPLMPLRRGGYAERLPVFGAMYDQTFKGHRLGAQIILERPYSSFVSISHKTSPGPIARHGFFIHPISSRPCVP